jgi:hypothetical protein
MGDYVGMTAIHVNRVLRSLRLAKIVVVENHVVLMGDLARLRQLAGFEPEEAPVAETDPRGRPSVFIPSGELLRPEQSRDDR